MSDCIHDDVARDARDDHRANPRAHEVEGASGEPFVRTSRLEPADDWWSRFAADHGTVA